MLRQELGKGYSGVVYLAEHIKLKDFRAIKCISKHHFMYEQLLKEARLLKNLKHPGIPIIYDIEEDNENAYIIEEYAQGESLQSLVLHSKSISQSEIIDFTLQICSIMEYLHSLRPLKVVHLDLKPLHIIICNGRIKIIDFGGAVMVENKSFPENPMGTPGFAAPEQYAASAVDERTDIYAIGAILNFMEEHKKISEFEKSQFTMKHLYELSEILNQIIRKCMEPDPNHRYQTVRKLKNALSEVKISMDFRPEINASLIIAIVGSQPGIGTSHLGISLVSHLNKKGHSCIYEEKGNVPILFELQRNHKQMEEKEGICRYKNFIAKPEYGKAVLCRKKDFSIAVQDYGCLKEEEELKNAHILLAVLGSKEWEEEKSRELIKQWKHHEKVRFIFNFGEPARVKELIKKFGLKYGYCMPYFSNPFLEEPRTRQFLEKLMKKTFLDKKGREGI